MAELHRKVLLIGPQPPPDHGTSVPFRQLADVVRGCPGVAVRIVNTQSGDKAGVPLYSPRAFLPFLRIWYQIVAAALWCDVAISYGSQRFNCTVGLLTTLVLRLLGRPTHVRVAGGDFDNYYFAMPGWRRRLVRVCLSQAASLIVETRLVGSRLSGEFDNLVVMPNWIVTHEAVRPVGGAGSAIRFAMVAEIRAEKGVVELLEAFQLARRSLDGAAITIELGLVGPVREGFQDAFSAALMRSGTGVMHRGQMAIEDLIPWLAAQDVFVLPTRFQGEGYPGVVLEALALGLPVVTTRWRSLPEIVEDGRNGLLCEPGDVHALAGAIERLAQDHALRARLGNNGRAEAHRFQARTVLRPLLERCDLTEDM